MDSANGLFEKLMSDQFSNEKDLVEEALENVDPNYLRESLKTLTKEPHIAGHRRDNELIDYIRQTWIDNGLDRVEIAEYDLYLSWPNKVHIFLSNFLRKSLILTEFLRNHLLIPVSSAKF